MHLEFQPADAPDPDDPDVEYGVRQNRSPPSYSNSARSSSARPAHSCTPSCDEFLTEHGHHGGLGWFIDVLGFTTLTRTAQASNVGDPSR